MRVPRIDRILKQDLPEAPGWVDRLLDPLNRFIESIGSAVGGRLTIGDNLTGLYHEAQFTTLAGYSGGSWTAYAFPVPFTARWVQIAQLEQIATSYTPVTAATHVDWLQLDGRVQVRFVAGLANSTTYRLRLVVLP